MPSGLYQLPGNWSSLGMVSPGNIDINARKVYMAPDGTYRTENSMSIGTDQGEVLIPTVVNGQQLTEDQAIDYYMKTGENLGIFASPDAAENYANSLHLRQAEFYKPPKQPQPRPRPMNAREQLIRKLKDGK